MLNKHEPLMPRKLFFFRISRYAGFAALLMVFSLGIGMAGYHLIEHQDWPDAFLNAAMLLGAMGPVGSPTTTAGKIFAGCYALYCGLVFLFIAGLLVTPFAHRFLHIFHSDPDEPDKEEHSKRKQK